jgi:quercetin dioxygenase-like cupin family protein
MKIKGIMRRKFGAMLMLLSLLVSGSAQDTNQPIQNSQSLSISRSGSRTSQPGPTVNFTGSVRVEPLIQVLPPSRMSGGSVTFEPGARTAWHTHPVGQTLIVTAGIGRVQSWGNPVDEIRQGDVVRIPHNVKHWHGASPNSAMTHIAILEQLDGKSTEWMEKVTDVQYNAPVSTVAPTNSAVQNNNSAPLMIQEQGSFAVGGTVVTAPGTFDPIKHGAYNPINPISEGQTLHGDHAYAFYQVPVNARKLPLVFWHGHGQSAKTWETTPDGREGFQNIFLRRRFPIYLIDQPRRGRAARSTQSVNLAVVPDEQLWYGIFRIGAYPNFYPGVQFSRNPDALNQFFRSMVPNTGPYDAQVNTDAVSALFDRVGPGILVTHSQSGGLGWRAAMKNANVRAIISFEPAFDFPFPEGEAPAGMNLGGRELKPVVVPVSEFMKFTKIPIVIYYRDFIPDKPSTNPGQEQWRIFYEVAKRWRDAVNKRGGDVTLVHLPQIGIRGNTHFPMSDLNNVEIADLMSKFLKEKGLD